MDNRTNVKPAEIEEAFIALEELEETTSTNTKAAILAAYQENLVLKTLFYYAFNSFKQYYIKQIPEPKAACKTIDPDNYYAFQKLLEALNAREKKDVKGHVEAFLKLCNYQEQKWFRRILARDLQIGMTQKGVNKVYKNLIPVYDVLLAESIKDPTLTDKKTIARLPEAYVLQYKIDGYRVNLHKDEKGDVVIKTRSGLPVTGYEKVEEEARKFLPCGKVYDGEMVSPKLFAWIEQNMLQDKNVKISDRSFFYDTMRHVFSKETGKEGIFNIFDAVDKTEWESQNAKKTYRERLDFLNADVKGVLAENDASQMTIVPTSKIFYRNNPEDIAETVRIFHKFLSWGWEGLMIKSIESPYAWKRSKSIWKMKMMDTKDLQVLAVQEGEGRRAGSVGALICDYNGTPLKIGTGKMTMDECTAYFKNPNLIIGKTVEVLYQAESIGKHGEPVLDFARYKQIRKDK